MVGSVPQSSVRPSPAGRAAHPSSLATLDAMASLTRQTGSVAHVIVAREPGVVDHARGAARANGVALTADLMPYSIRVRFSPR